VVDSAVKPSRIGEALTAVGFLLLVGAAVVWALVRNGIWR
jgi:hypothetical protein